MDNVLLGVSVGGGMWWKDVVEDNIFTKELVLDRRRGFYPVR